MNLMAFLFGGQFGSANEFNSGSLAGTGSWLATFNSVMIGQRQCIQFLARRLSDQFIRAISAIGEIGVQMEVGKPIVWARVHLTILAGRSNSPFTLSKIPLTN